MKKYEIWLLGMKKDYTVNDFDRFLRNFRDLKDAKKYFYKLIADPLKYKWLYDQITPHCQLVLEEVEYSDGEETCIDRVLEEDLW